MVRSHPTADLPETMTRLIQQARIAILIAKSLTCARRRVSLTHANPVLQQICPLEAGTNHGGSSRLAIVPRDFARSGGCT